MAPALSDLRSVQRVDQCCVDDSAILRQQRRAEYPGGRHEDSVCWIALKGVGQRGQLRRNGRGDAVPPHQRRSHRRVASMEILLRRLLSLDYVTEHTGLPWLPTEPVKVAAFEALGIERRHLPLRVHRGAVGETQHYFRLKLSIALAGC